MKAGILGLLAAVPLASSMAAEAATVVVAGREWRQLTDALNFTWNQVATVCNPTTGACAGSLGATSFDGWTWASNSDVQSLFEQLILPGTTQFPSSTSFFVALVSPDIDAAIGAAAFQPTNATGGAEIVLGWSRTLNPSQPGNAYAPFLIDYFSSADRADLGHFWSVTSARSDGGVWLYRTVPEPGSFMLAGLGLLGIGVMRRRDPRQGRRANQRSPA